MPRFDVRQPVPSTVSSQPSNERAQDPAEFIPSPDGGLDYGEITPEMSKVMRRQEGKIRLTRGVQNSDGTGYGLVHIEANHGKQILGLGYHSVQEFVAHVARSIQQVWQVPGDSQLLVTAKDGRKDVMYIRSEISKAGDFYRVNSAFPVRQENYESLKGMKKIWDGSEPTSAVSGQRPAFATAASASPETESSQGSSNARGQTASVPPSTPEVKSYTAEDVATEAKKASNRNKTLLERRADAILDKPTNLPLHAGLGTGTRRESMDKAVSQGRFIEQAAAFDSAAKKKDTVAVDLARANDYILGLSNENIPVVKAALEAQARLKENKYEKPEYRVYSGSDRNGSFYQISKTEYGYARSMLEFQSSAPATTASDATENVAEPSKSKKPAGGKSLRAAAYDKNPLMTFLATHGLFHDKDKPNSHKSEFSPDKTIMVMGYGPVFKKTGKRLDVLTNNAIEEGYLPKDGTESQLRELVRRAIAGEKISPLYAQGIAEQIAEQSYAEHLAQQQEAAQNEDFDDPFAPMLDGDFVADDFAVPGYDEASDPIKLEVNALLALADDAGINEDALDSIKEDAHYATLDQSEQAYYEAYRDAIKAAIAASGRDSSADTGETGNAQGQGSQEGLTLTSPSRQDVIAQQDALEAEAKRKEEGGDKPLPRRQLTGDVPDMFNTQGSVFDQPAEPEAPVAPVDRSEGWSVAPQESPPEVKSYTAEDVAAAEKQAAQQIEAWIDKLKGDAFLKIAKRFLPTMGVKPTLSKASNKAAFTGPKVNLLAAASELGVELPVSVRAALEAKQEGKVQEAANDRVPEQSIMSHTDAHAATMQAVRDGTATPEQFKTSFEAVVSNKDAIKSELMGKTKAELLKIGGPFVQMRYANEKKADIVDIVYREMVGEYALGESVTYGMAKDSYQNAIRRMVDATDADKLAQYVKDRKAAIAEYVAERAAKAAALENPQTLDDYRAVMRQHVSEGKTSKEAFLMLTPEQRVRFDELSAESTKESREARKRAAKTEVRAAGQTTAGEIIATKHTRDGYDLFVVKLADRVSKEDYATLLGSAKRMGGWYSAFRGNGAIPGFQFKDKANAEAFLKLAAGDTTEAQAKAAERRDAFEDDRSQSAVERLTEMADRLEERATEALNAERKANTARRARFAASAEASANSDSALAKTMRNMAQAISDGKAKFLDAVRQKVQVEMLRGMVRTAKDEELRAKYPSYADQEKHRGEKPTDQTADFAEFPSYTAFRSDLASLARQMLEVDGTKKLGQQLMRVADDVTDAFTAFAKENSHKLMRFSTKDGGLAAFSTQEKAQAAIERSGFKGKAIPFMVKRGEWTIITSPSEAINQGIWKGDGDKRITLSRDFGNELVQAIGRRGNKQNQLSVPWQFENANTRLKALSRMGIETSAEFRSALREFIRLQEHPAAPDKVKELERAMVGRRNDGMDFFPTPQSVADEMVQAADIEPGMRVLEPSAGMGHIAERIRESGVEPDVVEMANDRRELLEVKGFNLVGNDFLTTEGQYDRIVMNPPFSEGRDIQHVQHAYSMLKPGGRLVAIMGESAFTNQNKRATEFREWLESVGGTEEKLPDGSFMDPSLPVNTGANARMVVIDKQAEEAPASFNSGDRKYSVARPLENGERASSVSPGFYVNGVLQKNGREIDFNRSTTVGSMGHAMVKFSLDADKPVQKFPPLANQSTAKALNDTLVRYGLGQEWSNAYEAVKLPDALSGVRKALQVAFGRDIRPVAPTAAKFNIFNGVYVQSQPNAVYVNVASDTGFINIAGHELWHIIKRQRPELIDWYRRQSRKFYKDLPAYRDRLNALVQPGEKPYGIEAAEEELEADFMGDSLTDRDFLQSLADASPSKFTALLNQVRLLLAGILNRIKGLGSAKEVTDVKALQSYLKEVLVAFADGKPMPDAPSGIAFSRGTNEAVTKSNDVVGNQGWRSADDSTPGASAARQILDAMAHDEDAEYALRVIPGDFEGAINVGDTLPVSKQWVNGSETDKPLHGTSATRIRAADEKSVMDALRNLGATGKNGPNGYYFGNRIVLVKGESIGSGEDVGESIIKNAEVVGIWSKPTKGLSAIQPNESTAPDSGGAFSRDQINTAENALRELSKIDDMFVYPKSDKTDMAGIIADNRRGIKFKESSYGNETLYKLTIPNVKGEAKIWVRKPNPYGPSVYGMDLVDGEATNLITERPGDNPDDVPPDTEDVYIDVSDLKEGDYGALIYNIAATYAHNTGRIFIGDPSGLSDIAMRRRLENMISTAIKFGTTDHIAPHPKQVDGNPAIGVPPLEWVYGDSVGNLERMIDVSLQSSKNAGNEEIIYEPDAGNFTLTTPSGEVLAGEPGASAERLPSVPGSRRKGWRTDARRAIFDALLREEGQASSGQGRRDGLLERLLSLGNQRNDATRQIFYSRRSSGAVQGAGAVTKSSIGNNADIRFSRSATLQKVGDVLNETFNYPGTVSKWHTTVGSMYNLAERSPLFKPVFDATQDFLNDVSYYGTEVGYSCPMLLATRESAMNLTPETSHLLPPVGRYWLESQGLPQSDYQVFLDHVEKGGELLRVRLSSMPFYANRAKQAADKGDEMAYWKGFFLSGINAMTPQDRSSTLAEVRARCRALVP